MKYELHRTQGNSPSVQQLQRFYKRNGHKGKIQPNDHCLWLQQGDEIAACVRLSPASDGNYLLLKGLWVKRTLRGQGIGAQLLQQLNAALAPNQHCFCLAYPHLEHFYQQHGYHSVGEEVCPAYLWQRFLRYRNRGTELVLMKYLPTANILPTTSA